MTHICSGCGFPDRPNFIGETPCSVCGYPFTEVDEVQKSIDRFFTAMKKPPFPKGTKVTVLRTVDAAGNAIPPSYYAPWIEHGTVAEICEQHGDFYEVRTLDSARIGLVSRGHVEECNT